MHILICKIKDERIFIFIHVVIFNQYRTQNEQIPSVIKVPRQRADKLAKLCLPLVENRENYKLHSTNEPQEPVLTSLTSP